MSKPVIDQRSSFPTNRKNLTFANWEKEKKRQANRALDTKYKKAAKKRKEKASLDEIERLKAVEQQFKAYREKVTNNSLFKEPPTYVPNMGKEFYNTREWRNLRWKVMEDSDGCCSVCGRNRKAHGVVLHVDHIKPRSKYPKLELVKSNMQVLCAECNIGKGARKQTF